MLISCKYFYIITHTVEVLNPSAPRTSSSEIIIQTPYPFGLVILYLTSCAFDAVRNANGIGNIQSIPPPHHTHLHPLHPATRLQAHTMVTSFYPPIPSGTRICLLFLCVLTKIHPALPFHLTSSLLQFSKH